MTVPFNHVVDLLSQSLHLSQDFPLASAPTPGVSDCIPDFSSVSRIHMAKFLTLIRRALIVIAC